VLGNSNAKCELKVSLRLQAYLPLPLRRPAPEPVAGAGVAVVLGDVAAVLEILLGDAAGSRVAEATDEDARACARGGLADLGASDEEEEDDEEEEEEETGGTFSLRLCRFKLGIPIPKDPAQERTFM